MSVDTTTPVKAKRPKWHYIAGAVGALLLCGIVGNMMGDDDDKAAAPVTSGSDSATSAPAATDKPAEPTAAPKLAGIGEAVTAGDLAWTVVAVEDKGQTWAGQFDSKTTAGRYLKVDLAMTNNGSEEVTIFMQPSIKDSKGREFKATDELMMVIGSDDWCMGKSLPAGVPQKCTNGYELPADATGLTLIVDDGGLMQGEKTSIDLGQ